MTEINPRINSTQAGQIAKQLDKKDGKEDGKISASIWNEFVADKGGKEIKYSITLENAMKSISTYLHKNANNVGQSVKDLADSWLKKEVEVNKTTNPSPVKGTEGATPTTPTKPVQRPENAPPLKVEYPPVPPKGKDMSEVDYIEFNSMQGKWVQGHKADGKNVANFIRSFLEGKGLDANYLHGDANACIARLNKDNVAYVIQNLGDLLFESENGETLFNDLINNLKTKAKELGIVIPNNMNKDGIEQLAQAIIDKNESAINEMNAFQSIKTPNPELAGKTIVDKATGYEYNYDENGVIDIIRDKDGYGVFYRNTSGGSSLNLENGDFCSLDENGNIIDYTTRDEKGYVMRNADGSVIDFEIGEINYIIDQNTGNIRYSWEYPYYSHVYRDKDGNLICYASRNSSGDYSYYDANDNEISIDEYLELCPDT